MAAMRSTYIARLLVSICVFGMFQVSEGGQLCGSCTHISDPRNCDHVTRCGDHEKCMASQYVTTGGHVMYDEGCMASFRCNSLGRRDSGDDETLRERSQDGRHTLCQSCCNDTTICNTMHGLCNTQPLNTNGYILCYNCPQMASPNQCDKIIRCSVRQQCYVGQTVNHLSGARVWESRCGHDPQECMGTVSMASMIIGKRLSAFCGKCCNHTNFCNDECSNSAIATVLPTTPPTPTQPTPTPPTPTPALTSSTILSTTPTSPTPTMTSSTPTSSPTVFTRPTITSISPSHHVLLGASVSLHCTATGNPPPHIGWGVTHFNIANNKPTNTQILDGGRTIHIEHFISDNAGLYICIATNALGTNSKVAVINEVIAPSTKVTTTMNTTPVPSPQLSAPVITYSTNIHHAQIESNVRLICMASGYPTPTISWSFGTAGQPPDNLSLVGGELHINGFKSQNYGTYRCRAQNSQGEVFKFFIIAQ